MNALLLGAWLVASVPTLAHAATGAAGLSADPAQVLAGTRTVGAVTMMPGEIYQGPGPITVGWLGAKKQLLLPNGAWVLLAVADRASLHATPVPLVSMVFGQFRDDRAVSLLGFLFNGRAANPRQTWSEVEACPREAPPKRADREVRIDGRDIGCGWTMPVSAMPKPNDAAWEQALELLPRLGVAQVPTARQYTRAWATDADAGYVALRRVDFEAREGQQQARLQWLNQYLPLMQQGLHKNIAAAELEPEGAKTAPSRVKLPD